MAAITWEQLDTYTSADDIADLLRCASIKGERFSVPDCPLAKAAGWWVFNEYRILRDKDGGTDVIMPLTKAERNFLHLFDSTHLYDDLVLES